MRMKLDRSPGSGRFSLPFGAGPRFLALVSLIVGIACWLPGAWQSDHPPAGPEQSLRIEGITAWLGMSKEEAIRQFSDLFLVREGPPDLLVILKRPGKAAEDEVGSVRFSEEKAVSLRSVRSFPPEGFAGTIEAEAVRLFLERVANLAGDGPKQATIAAGRLEEVPGPSGPLSLQILNIGRGSRTVAAVLREGEEGASFTITESVEMK